MSKIIIGADIVPTLSNYKFFENCCMDKIIDKELFSLLNKFDYRIFNLEVPLVDTKKPIKKCGPNLMASKKTINGLKQLKIDFVTLANNHILDQGEQGLKSTINQLKKAKISYCGVGNTKEEASKAYIFEIDKKKIGIYCCCEHEFTIVNDEHAGANPFNALESLDHIENLKKVCDYVICLFHGGKEYYRYPSPDLQKTCRKIVEKGANLVICQHSHCIGCEEHWENGKIIYGQGNFLFDNCDNEFCDTSILVSVDIEKNKIEYIPICKNGNGVRLAKKEKNKILNEFLERSKMVDNKKFLNENYNKFCDKFYSLLLLLGGVNIRSYLYRGINKLSGYKLGKWWSKHILSEEKKLML